MPRPGRAQHAEAMKAVRAIAADAMQTPDIRQAAALLVKTERRDPDTLSDAVATIKNKLATNVEKHAALRAIADILR